MAFKYFQALKNSGQTPAKEVSIHRICQVVAINEDLPLLDKNTHTSKFTLASGRRVPIDMNFKLPPDTIESILAGKSFLFFYGEITYKDIFGESHLTKFRLFQGLNFGFNTPELMQAAEGNESN